MKSLINRLLGMRLGALILKELRHIKRDHHLIATLDLPGMKKEDIEVSIQDGTLIIRGEKKEETERKEKGAVRTERFYGSFHRAVNLPTAVDDTKVKANYKSGVLELTLPKKEEAKPKSKIIAIE